MRKNYVSLLTSIAVCFVFFSFLFSCNNDESGTTAANDRVDSAKLMVERGSYLANHVSVCIDCHSQRDFNQFSGPVKPGTEGMGGEEFNEKLGIPGVIYARNITPDTVNGIGKWTDEEIERAMTKGISKNGDTLFPLMPYFHYNSLNRDDVNSIIAYIRTLKPNSNKVPERKLFIPLSMAYPPLHSESPEKNSKPDVADMVKYGEYVVNSAACFDCHTPMEKGQYLMNKAFAGGFYFDMGGFRVNSGNITPDSSTGIGLWTETVFLEKFKNYRDPATYKTDPGKNNSMMPWTMYAQMDDFDIKAIYRYLRTLPPISNKVEKYPN